MTDDLIVIAIPRRVAEHYERRGKSEQGSENSSHIFKACAEALNSPVAYAPIKAGRLLAYEELRTAAWIVVNKWIDARAGRMKEALIALDRLDLDDLPSAICDPTEGDTP